MGECNIRSGAAYEEMTITPSAAALAGEVIAVGEILGFFLVDFTAAMLAAAEEAAFIFRSAKCSVTKLAGEAWSQGDRVFWDATAGSFTITDDGTLVLAGFVIEDAASAAVVGEIAFIGDAEMLSGGMKTASGDAAVTGSLADTDTGLTLILQAFCCVKIAAQGAGEAGYVTVDFGADGLLDIYAWDDAGAAATVAATIHWFAIGV